MLSVNCCRNKDVSRRAVSTAIRCTVGRYEVPDIYIVYYSTIQYTSVLDDLTPQFLEPEEKMAPTYCTVKVYRRSKHTSR